MHWLVQFFVALVLCATTGWCVWYIMNDKLKTERRHLLFPYIKDINHHNFMQVMGELMQCHDAYNVMTALRGPDTQDASRTDLDLKAATTAVLRYQIAGHWTYGHCWPDDECYVAYRRQLDPNSNDHFLTHARSAFAAAGLKWNKLNPDPHDR